MLIRQFYDPGAIGISANCKTKTKTKTKAKTVRQ
jgi:hypothetical protein